MGSDGDAWFSSDLVLVDNAAQTSAASATTGTGSAPGSPDVGNVATAHAHRAGPAKRKCGATSAGTTVTSGSGASACISETPDKKRTCKDRQVTFALGTKENDWLRPGSAALVEYVKDMFKKEPGPDAVVPSMCRASNLDGLLALRVRMHDLVERCAGLEPLAHAHILLGGGSGVSAVTSAHLPFLTRHLQRLEDAIVQLRNSSA